MQAWPYSSVAVTLVALLGLAACDRTNYEPSFFRTVESHNAALVTDAKQRVVINFGTKNSSNGVRSGTICAEPSPDVTQAFSEALNLVVSAPESIGASDEDARGGRVGGNFVNNFASSIAQLGERLAVIQLFRDRMYRACEAYANGAIDETAYTLMLARGDKAMATLLTAEMAAGAFGRSFARIGSVSEISATHLKEREVLHEKINELTQELVEIAGSDAEDRGVNAQKTSKELTDAYAALLVLDLTRARVTANSGTGDSRSGVIAGAGIGFTDRATVGGLPDIHRTFLDDPGLEPLTDACLTALTKVQLEEGQARQVAEAQGKIKVAVKIAELDNETIAFLQRTLNEGIFNERGIITNVLDQDKNTLVDLDVDSDGDKVFSKKEIEDAIERSQKSKREQESLIRSGEIDVSSVMLKAGNPFAGFCAASIFGNLSENGFIKTMLDSRKELREVGNEVKLMHLTVCTKMLDQELDAVQRAAVLSFCSKDAR